MQRKGFSFSHIGLYVRDLARMEVFYTRLLGFTVTDRGTLDGPRGEVSLVFLSRDPDEHHQIVLASGRPPEHGFNPINQISFKADSLATLLAMYARLRELEPGGLAPVTHGNAVSIYLHDPEENRLELYFDLPWYVTQPMRIAVDLAGDEATLLARLEAHARTLPGFRPRAEWRLDMAQRMGIEETVPWYRDA